MTENFDKGLALFREWYGDEMAGDTRAYALGDEGFGPLQAKWTLEFPFGQVWTREERLPRKLRSLAVIGMLIGQGQANELKLHVKIGLRNGLTRQELEEVFYTALPYCGFPLANSAKTAMMEAFAELEAEGVAVS